MLFSWYHEISSIAIFFLFWYGTIATKNGSMHANRARLSALLVLWSVVFQMRLWLLVWDRVQAGVGFGLGVGFGHGRDQARTVRHRHHLFPKLHEVLQPILLRIGLLRCCGLFLHPFVSPSQGRRHRLWIYSSISFCVCIS